MIDRRTAEIAFALMTTAFGLVVAIGATEFGVGWSAAGPQPGTFPFYIGGIVALASLGNLVMAFRHPSGRDQFISREQLISLARFALPMLAFVIASLWLGVYVATALYLLGVMVLQGRYPLWHAALVAVGLPIALYLILEKGFKVALLKGPLEAWLGL